MYRRTVSLKTLVRLEACSSQRELFEKHFGKSVRVTSGLCVRVANKFDWDWAAQHLISSQALVEYNRARDQARDEYNRARDQARDEYNRARDQAKDEFTKTIDEFTKTIDEYRKASNQAMDEYTKACGQATDEYRRSGTDEYYKACARVFCELYNKDV
jgi:Rps23 Pro-64 3,4-dihydroxylase Tpa1-like proline 4-hydroxylase